MVQCVETTQPMDPGGCSKASSRAGALSGAVGRENFAWVVSRLRMSALVWKHVLLDAFLHLFAIEWTYVSKCLILDSKWTLALCSSWEFRQTKQNGRIIPVTKSLYWEVSKDEPRSRSPAEHRSPLGQKTLGTAWHQQTRIIKGSSTIKQQGLERCWRFTGCSEATLAKFRTATGWQQGLHALQKTRSKCFSWRFNSSKNSRLCEVLVVRISSDSANMSSNNAPLQTFQH